MSSTKRPAAVPDPPTHGVDADPPAVRRSRPRTLDARAGCLDPLAHWGAPLLDAEHEAVLARRIEAGLLAREALERGVAPDGGPLPASRDELHHLVREGQQAWERFHASNIGLVVRAVVEINGRADDDLLQQGFEALGAALRAYDVERGCRFSTLAHRYVHNAVTLARRRRDSLLTASEGRLRGLALVGATRAELEESGRDPGVDAVAERVGRPAEWVAAHWTREHRMGADISEIDLDPPAPPGDEDAGDWWLDELPAVERRVLCARFGLRGSAVLGHRVLAAQERMTVSALRTVERRALDHVRELLLHGEIRRQPVPAPLDLIAC